jgi:hypothetical protein
MAPDAARRREVGQILLLAAGFLVLVAISVASVLLVNRARDDNSMVVHTVQVENRSTRCCSKSAAPRAPRAAIC